jgi:hypothetical protein
LAAKRGEEERGDEEAGEGEERRGGGRGTFIIDFMTESL